MIRRKVKTVSNKNRKTSIVQFDSAIGYTFDIDTRLGMMDYYPGDLIVFHERTTPGIDPFLQHLETSSPLNLFSRTRSFLVLGVSHKPMTVTEGVPRNCYVLMVTPYDPTIDRYKHKAFPLTKLFFLEEETKHTDFNVRAVPAVIPEIPPDIEILYRFGYKHLHEMRQLPWNIILSEETY